MADQQHLASLNGGDQTDGGISALDDGTASAPGSPADGGGAFAAAQGEAEATPLSAAEWRLASPKPGLISTDTASANIDPGSGLDLAQAPSFSPPTALEGFPSADPAPGIAAFFGGAAAPTIAAPVASGVASTSDGAPAPTIEAPIATGAASTSDGAAAASDGGPVAMGGASATAATGGAPVILASGFAPETITLAGSGLVFDNTYSASVTAAYRSAIIAAEHFYQSEYTNSVTLDMNFDFAPLGVNFAAENSFNTVDVAYATLKSALQSHAATSLQQAAVAALPASDPSHGDLFGVSIGMADILGIAGGATGTDNVTLSSSLSWTFGQDVVGAMEHEISEGAMGRIGSLGFAIVNAGQSEWAPMDLFRYSAVNTPDYTGGRDGQETFFSVNGSTLSTQNFHNSVNSSGGFDGFDLADWDSTVGDSFGPGGPGTGATLSTTDLQVMNVLGWDPTLPQLSAPGALTIGENRTVSLPVSVTPANSGDSISVTLSGIPTGVQLSDNAGSLTVTNGTITLTAAQLAGLSVYATAATTGTIAVAAMDATTGSANATQQLILRVDPVTNNTSTLTNTVTLTGGDYLYNSPTGLINVYGTAVLGTGSPNAVTNAGTIEGTGTAGIGIDLTTGGSVTNDSGALITGFADGVLGASNVINYGTIVTTDTGTLPGLAIQMGAGTIVNHGTIQNLDTLAGSGGTSGLAIALEGGLLINGAGAIIDGGGACALVAGYGTSGAAVTVDNFGTIKTESTQNSALYFAAGGSVTNAAGALIAAPKTAIAFQGTLATKDRLGTVVNYGIIQSTASTAGNGAVYFGQGGILTNALGGQITAVRNDVDIIGAAGTITNLGTIANTGTNSTIYLRAGGLVTNGSSLSNAALVNASRTGISFNDTVGTTVSFGTVVNFGTIQSNASGTSGVAIYFGQGGILTNEAGGLITSSGRGDVSAKLNAAAVVNYGTIKTGSTLSAVYFGAGGTLTNSGGAVVKSAGGTAVVVKGTAAGTVVNSGNIVSNAATAASGVYLGHGGLVTNQVGGTISAVLGAVSIKGGAGNVVNHGSISGQSGVNIGLTGVGTGSVFNDGVIAASFTSGFVSAVNLSAGGTVTNQGTLTASGTNGNAVNVLGGAGFVNNSAGALIAGPGNGIFMSAGTVVNAGSITGTGVPQTGTIAPFTAGVNLPSGAVSNSGRITALNPGGVGVVGGTVLNNAAAALIEGYQTGFQTGYANFATGSYSGAGTVTNLGTILAIGSGFSTGANLSAGGSVTNGAGTATGALIEGGGTGLQFGFSTATTHVGVGTLTNFGTVAASGVTSGTGVELQAGGLVVNGANGSTAALIEGASGGIQAGFNNIFTSGGAGGIATAVNYGQVLQTGTNGSAINLNGGGTVINGSPGSPGAFIPGPPGSPGTVIPPVPADTTALIEGQSGIQVGANSFGTAGAGIGTVSNFGTVIAGGSAGPAVNLADGGFVSNGASGSTAALIESNAIGVLTGFNTAFGGGSSAGGIATVVNYGRILGAGGFDAVDLNGGGTLLNAGSGLIQGSQGILVGAVGAGSTLAAGVGTIVNFGTVAQLGSFGTAVDLADGGSLTNGSPGNTAALVEGNNGVVQAGFNNVFMGGTVTGGVATIANYGRILETGGGGPVVILSGGGTVINGPSGTTGALIQGPNGIQVGGVGAFGTSGAGIGTITNYGTVAAFGSFGTAILLNGGGSLTNGASGSSAALIDGGANGVQAGFNNVFNSGSNAVVAGGMAAIVNYGRILATAGTFGNAVALMGGGSVTNAAGGLIHGIQEGVQLGTNNGTVGAGIGTVNNLGTILGTGTFGAGINLADGGLVTNGAAGSGAALIAGQETGIQLGFGNSTSFGGSGTVVNFGVIEATGTGFAPGVNLTGGGFVDNAGSLATISGSTGVQLNNGTLDNFGTIVGSGGNAVVLGPGSSTLIVEPGAVFNGSVGGFNSADTIDFAQRTVTSVGFAGGTLTAFNNGSVVSTLGLSGAFSANQFSLASDGHGGTDVTLGGTSGPGTRLTENAPGAISVPQHTPSPIPGFSAGDTNTTENITSTLTAQHGVLSFNTAGLVGFTGLNTGSATLTGTVSEVDNALAPLEYTGNSGFSDPDTVSFQTSDGTLTAGPTFTTINVGTSGPGQQLSEMVPPGPLSATENVQQPLSGFSINDTNVNENVTTTLTAQHGVLSFNTSGLIGFTGLNSGSVTLTGDVGEINSALSSLDYDGNPGFTGPDSLSMLSSDGTLTAGPLSVAINVTSGGTTVSGIGHVLSGTYTSGVVLSNPTTQNPATVTQTGYVTNAGGGTALTAGTAGVPWTIANYGSIVGIGTNGIGIELSNGGTIDNSGSIAGTVTGIQVDAAAGTVINSGRIAATSNGSFSIGVHLNAGGYVLNGASGSSNAVITGGMNGVELDNAAGSVVNFGTISDTGAGNGGGVVLNAGGTVGNFGTVSATGTSSTGVLLQNGGTVLNGGSGATTALIAGYQQGVEIGVFNGSGGASGFGTVVNLGTIEATGTGFSIGANLVAGGNVTNGASGATGALIRGVQDGVQIGSSNGTIEVGPGTVSNFGTILATGTFGAGVNLVDGGSLTNGGSGSTAALIRGVSDGVEIGFINGGTATGGSGIVVNFATILASGTGFAPGVNLLDGGVVDNYGTVSGTPGVIAGGTAIATVNNSGVISGGINLLSGGSVNNNHGTISGQNGINIGNPPGIGTVFNSGLIAGIGSGFVAGINLQAGGTVTNQGTITAGGTNAFAVNLSDNLGETTLVTNGASGATAALISGSNGGVQIGPFGTIAGGVATIVNFGTIAATGTSGSGVNIGSATFATVANYGLIQAAGSTSSALSLGNGTVRNLGTIINNTGGTLANDFGVNIASGAGATIVNGASSATGALIEGYHIGVLAGGTSGVGSTVVNFGTIASTQTGVVTSGTFTNLVGVAVSLFAHGGSVINYGLITSKEQGVNISNGPAVLTNLGTITAGSQQNVGVALSTGGSVTNGASGATGALIFDATSNAIVITGASGTVTNFGTVSTTTTINSAIYLQRNGLVTNGASGSTAALIEGRTGISFSKPSATLSGFGTVDNFGTIIATGVTGGVGVYLGQGGIVTNEAGGTITSIRNDVVILSAVGTVTNFGTIENTGTNGAIYLRAGGMVTNAVDAQIISMRRGIVFNDTVTTTVSFGTVVNAGTILAAGTGSVSAVYFGQGGRLTNQASGTISGANGGVGLVGGGTIDNFGAIIGGNGTAVSFGAGNDVLIVETSAVFGGALAGFAAGDTIDFAQETVTSVGFVNNSLTAFNNGTAIGTIGVIGTFTAGQLALTPDGHGGTDVTLGISSPSTIVNTGTILSAVTLTGGSYLDNTATGVINVAGTGVLGIDAPNSVANFGLIEGTGTSGLGVSLTTGSTLANFGTIVGQGGTAAYFAGGGSHLTITPSSTIVGGVYGNHNGSVLELTAGAGPGTLTSDDTQFHGFDTIELDPNAVWSYSRTKPINNPKALDIGAGAALIVSGNISNASTVTVATAGPGGAVEIAGTVFLVLGGAFTLSDSVNNQILSNGSAAQLISNRQVISGAGTIGDAHLSVINRSSAVVDATGANALTLTGAGFNNAGLVEATGAGGLVVSGTTLTNSTAIDIATGAVSAAAGASVTLSGATVVGGNIVTAAGGMLRVNPGAASAIVNAAIVNNGSVQLGTAGQAGTLDLGGTVYLVRGGSFTLADNTGTAIVSNGSAAQLINNRGTIVGAGTIGDANLSIVNRSSAIIDAAGANALTLTGAGFSNAGLIEATGPGGLTVRNTTLTNSTAIDAASGTVFAAAGSSVTLTGATVTGGNIVTATGSSLQVGVGAASTIANAAIVNDGSVGVGGTLDIGGTVYLVRGGTVGLSAGAIDSDGSPATLINIRNTITGSGMIGDAGLSLVNQGSGWIAATAGNALTLAGAGLDNEGVLQANGGTLTVSAPVTGGGRAFVVGASTLDFGGSVAAGQTAIFQGNDAALVLDQSTNFHGKIGGFHGSDTIDLRDLRFSGSPTLGTVTQSGGDTFVPIADGGTSETLDLLNQPAGANYQLVSDNNDPAPGTLLELAGAPGGPQTAASHSYSVTEGSTVVASHLVVDAAHGVLTTAGGSNLSGNAVLVSGPADGSVALNPDGSFTYTPNAYFVSYADGSRANFSFIYSFTGNDSFTYRVADGGNTSNTATVTLTVTPPPHVHVNTDQYDMRNLYDDLALGSPHFTPGIVSSTPPNVPADRGFTVTTNRGVTYELQGTNLTYDPVTGAPNGGTINGSLVIEGTNPSYPRLDMISPSNGSPDPAWQFSATSFTQALQSYAASNDKTGLDAIFQTVRYDIVAAGPTHSNDVLVGGPFDDSEAGAGEASLLIGGAGNDFFIPSGATATGGPGADFFQYGSGGGSNTITDFSGVVGGDHDQIDLRAVVGTNKAHDFSQVQAHTQQVSADTVIDYSDTGGVNPLKITLSNFNSANLNAADFVYANVPPVAQNDSAATDRHTPITINVLANDSDADGDPLTIVGVAGNQAGTPSPTSTSFDGANISVSSSQVSYDPTASSFLQSQSAGGSSPDSFAYLISDGHGGKAWANVNVNVNVLIN